MRGAAGKEELREVILTLFGFPNVLQHFLYWFALGWPLFLLGTMIACAAMLRRYVTTREKALLYLPGGILIPVIIASFFAAYQESRYVFHIYPLLVVAFAWGIVRLADRMAGWNFGMGPGATIAGIAAIAFLVTGDVGPSTLAPLTRTYGDARDVMRSVISWPAYGRFHQDQVGAALYVREHMRAGDRVVVIGLPHQLHVYRFYTGRLDAAVTRTGNESYQRLREGRLIDRYTGAALVGDVDDLLKSEGATTWFIGDTVLASEEVTYFPAEVRNDARRVAVDAAFRGRDGRTFVVKVP
jgi:hypothetical protein